MVTKTTTRTTNNSPNPFEQTIQEVEHQIKLRKARNSYIDYVEYVNEGYVRSKFHTYLCDKIEQFMNKETEDSFDILLLSVPPQHGKSLTITETLPSYYLGRNPEKRVIICGYNEDFAIRFGRRNKDKIEQNQEELFPECKLAKNPNSNVGFETTKQGGCISRGILSGVTGNPCDLFIIDDPIKNRQEADSKKTRDTIYSEWLNSLMTRIGPKGKLIVIQTRWHEDDLYGMLAKDNPNAEVINIPCECEVDDPKLDPLGRNKGDALCPEIGRDNVWLKDFKLKFKSKKGSRAWTALYQGNPMLDGGNFIKEEWWRYYDDLELSDLPYSIISVDAAFKDGDDNDYVAIQVWGKKDNDYFLIDALKQHLNFVDTLSAIRSFKYKYPDTLYILIEDKANGTAIINVLSNEFEGIIPVLPEGGKISRVNAVSPAIENGRVFLPRYASFTSDFVAECSAFPNSSHDDQVDSMSQALSRMIFVDADVVNREKINYRIWTEDMFEDYYSAGDKLQDELLQKWGHPIEWREEDGE